MRNLLILAALVGVAMARPGIFGLGLGAGSHYHSPIPYSALISEGILPNLLAAGIPFPYPAPFEISSQYHTQDEKGQYSYGYAAGPSAKNEVRTADGVTQGAYAYIDARGQVQSVNYISDPVNGFRVAATNLPVAPKPIPVEPLVAPTPVEDTPEVAAAKKAHFAAYAEAKAAADAAPDDPEPVKGTVAVPAAVEHSQEPKEGDTPASTELLPPDILTREVEEIPYLSLALGEYDPETYYFAEIAQAIQSERLAYLSSLTPLERLAYATYAPLWHPSPAIPTPQATSLVSARTPHSNDPPVELTSQYHAQDEKGQYSYGYSGGPSTKSETRTADGITRGEYSYIDGEGKVQSVHYVADPVNGFRAIGTNIPGTPAAPSLETVHDTAVATATKEEHPAAA